MTNTPDTPNATASAPKTTRLASINKGKGLLPIGITVQQVNHPATAQRVDRVFLGIGIEIAHD